MSQGERKVRNCAGTKKQLVSSGQLIRLLHISVSPSRWVLSQGNVARRSTNPLHWLTAFLSFLAKKIACTHMCRLFEEEQRGAVPCVLCLCYVCSEERVHVLLSHSAFKASSQMLLIWRGALKKNPFSVWMQVSQCSPAGPDLPIGSIVWPLL